MAHPKHFTPHFAPNVKNIVNPDQRLPLDRWGDRESTTTFCDEVSEWETRWPARGGGSDNNGVALAGEPGVEVAAEASAEVIALPAASTRRSEVLEVVQTPGKNAWSPQLNSHSPLKSFDFILAGDVLYKQCLLDPFLGTVRDMLAPGGRMLLCHVPRAGVTYDIVERAFVEAGFAFEILNGDKKESNGESCSEEHQGPGDGTGSRLAVEAAHGSRCDTTAVGGVELCVDDARRARLYEVHSVD